MAFALAHAQDAFPMAAPVMAGVLLVIAALDGRKHEASASWQIYFGTLIAVVVGIAALNGNVQGPWVEFVRSYGSLIYTCALFIIFAKLAGADPRLPREAIRVGFWCNAGLAALYSFSALTVPISVLGTPLLSPGGSLNGLLGSKSPTAAVLGVFALVGIACWFQGSSLGHPLLFRIATITLTVSVFLTRSRASTLALCVGVLYLIWRHRRRIARSPLAVSRVLAMFAGAYFGLSSIASRFTDLASDENVLTRIELWLRGLDLWTDSPLVGFGLGSFQQVGLTTDGWMRSSGHYLEQTLQHSAVGGLHAHNVYIQLLAETGLLGFCLFLIPLVLAWKRSAAMRSLESTYRTMLVFLMVSGLVGGLTLTSPSTSWPLALLASSALVLGSRRSKPAIVGTGLQQARPPGAAKAQSIASITGRRLPESDLTPAAARRRQAPDAGGRSPDGRRAPELGAGDTGYPTISGMGSDDLVPLDGIVGPDPDATGQVPAGAPEGRAGFARLRRLAVPAFMARIGGVFFQFLSTVIAGRLGGPGAVGALGAYQSWTRAVAVGLTGGVNQPTLRAFSPNRSELTKETARRWSTRAARRSVSLGGALLMIVALPAFLIADTTGIAIAVTVIGALAISLSRLGSVLYQSRGRAEVLMVTDFALPGLLTVVLVATVGWTGDLTAATAVSATLVALVITALVGAWILLTLQRRLESGPVSSRLSDALDVREGIGTAVSQLSVLMIPAVPYIFLLYQDDGHDAGYYSIAMRVAGLSSIILTGLAATETPKFAIAAANLDVRAIRRLSRRSSLVVIALFMPIVIATLVSPGAVLRIFGSDSPDGRAVLIIIVVGQLVNALTGLSLPRLLMLGGHGTAARIAWVSLVISTVGCAIGAQYSVQWVAVATAAAMALKNVLEHLAGERLLRHLGTAQTQET